MLLNTIISQGEHQELKTNVRPFSQIEIGMEFARSLARFVRVAKYIRRAAQEDHSKVSGLHWLENKRSLVDILFDCFAYYHDLHTYTLIDMMVH